MEFRLRRHDGEYRWILNIGVPRFDQDGSFAGYIGICIDVHDRRLAEDKLHEYEKAVEELKKAVSLGGHQIVLSDLGSAYGLAGQENEAAAILEQLLEMRRQEYVPAICLARIYSRIGENDKAIEWLEKAFEERNGEMVFLQGEIEGAAAGDSLNNLGNDPRLMDLLKRMNLP